jgi:hypothetical protein
MYLKQKKYFVDNYTIFENSLTNNLVYNVFMKLIVKYLHVKR